MPALDSGDKKPTRISATSVVVGILTAILAGFFVLITVDIDLILKIVIFIPIILLGCGITWALHRDLDRGITAGTITFLVVLFFILLGVEIFRRPPTSLSTVQQTKTAIAITESQIISRNATQTALAERRTATAVASTQSANATQSYSLQTTAAAVYTQFPQICNGVWPQSSSLDPVSIPAFVGGIVGIVVGLLIAWWAPQPGIKIIGGIIVLCCLVIFGIAGWQILPFYSEPDLRESAEQTQPEWQAICSDIQTSTANAVMAATQRASETLQALLATNSFEDSFDTDEHGWVDPNEPYGIRHTIRDGSLHIEFPEEYQGGFFRPCDQGCELPTGYENYIFEIVFRTPQDNYAIGFFFGQSKSAVDYLDAYGLQIARDGHVIFSQIEPIDSLPPLYDDFSLYYHPTIDDTQTVYIHVENGKVTLRINDSPEVIVEQAITESVSGYFGFYTYDASVPLEILSLKITPLLP